MKPKIEAFAAVVRPGTRRFEREPAEQIAGLYYGKPDASAECRRFTRARVAHLTEKDPLKEAVNKAALYFFHHPDDEAARMKLDNAVRKQLGIE